MVNATDPEHFVLTPGHPLHPVYGQEDEGGFPEEAQATRKPAQLAAHTYKAEVGCVLPSSFPAPAASPPTAPAVPPSHSAAVRTAPCGTQLSPYSAGVDSPDVSLFAGASPGF